MIWEIRMRSGDAVLIDGGDVALAHAGALRIEPERLEGAFIVTTMGAKPEEVKRMFIRPDGWLVAARRS